MLATIAINSCAAGASASSITTRIKTCKAAILEHLLQVRVHLPLQQGLRQRLFNAPKFSRYGASASSITTRIKTRFFTIFAPFCKSASASSITTRIKTLPLFPHRKTTHVRVHLPLQQGLRLRRLLHHQVRPTLCECIFHYNKD